MELHGKKITLEGPVRYAIPLVAGAAAAAALGLSLNQVTPPPNTASVNVDLSAAGVPVSGTLSLTDPTTGNLIVPAQTGSNVTFIGVPYASTGSTYNLNASGVTGYTAQTISVMITMAIQSITFDLTTSTTEAVALSAGSADSNTITFTTVVSGAPTAVPITYAYNINAGSVTGTPVQHGSVVDTEANGTYPGVTITLATALANGTYGFTINALNASAVSLGTPLSFVVAVSGKLAVVIIGATGAAKNLTVHYTVSNTPAAKLVGFTYSIANHLNQVLGAGNSAYFSHANGTYTDTITPLKASGTGAALTLAAGTYACRLFAIGSNGGTVSGVLNFNFTV